MDGNRSSWPSRRRSLCRLGLYYVIIAFRQNHDFRRHSQVVRHDQPWLAPGPRHERQRLAFAPSREPVRASLTLTAAACAAIAPTRITLAAATSRSWTEPQPSQVHALTDKDNFAPTWPQSGQTPVMRWKRGWTCHGALAVDAALAAGGRVPGSAVEPGQPLCGRAWGGQPCRRCSGWRGEPVRRRCRPWAASARHTC